ncbi:uncharacterized protein LOC117112280 [Anneissia japonica]|uniref:uncharacterized protein LOC117112280 n=1 Tax=Anneissia japonica TaxID=1529436 RepID=UPI0014258546|nr:uncharacterized protein LOC117112280 [Anneissia japonica]
MCGNCSPVVSATAEPTPTKSGSKSTGSKTKHKPTKWKSQYYLENAVSDAPEILALAFKKVTESPMLQLNPDMAKQRNSAVMELQASKSVFEATASTLMTSLWEVTSEAEKKKTTSEGLDNVCRNFHVFHLNEKSNIFLGLGPF